MTLSGERVIDITVFDVYFPAFLYKFLTINSFMTEAVIIIYDDSLRHERVKIS